MEWYLVIVHSLWIAGISILLATWSYQYWQSKETTTASNLYSRPFWFGLFLICAGFAGISPYLWEKIIWAILTIFILFNFWHKWFTFNKK